MRNELLAEHEKRARPFASAEANDCLEKARSLGPAAEKEFLEVMALLGPSASAGAVLRKVYAKYGLEWIVSDTQRMLAFLRERNFGIGAGYGKGIYRITDPQTGKAIVQSDLFLAALCRRVWEQQAALNNAA
jgi:hypothetical protein